MQLLTRKQREDVISAILGVMLMLIVLGGTFLGLLSFLLMLLMGAVSWLPSLGYWQTFAVVGASYLAFAFIRGALRD